MLAEVHGIQRLDVIGDSKPRRVVPDICGERIRGMGWYGGDRNDGYIMRPDR